MLPPCIDKSPPPIKFWRSPTPPCSQHLWETLTSLGKLPSCLYNILSPISNISWKPNFYVLSQFEFSTGYTLWLCCLVQKDVGWDQQVLPKSIDRFNFIRAFHSYRFLQLLCKGMPSHIVILFGREKLLSARSFFATEI